MLATFQGKTKDKGLQSNVLKAELPQSQSFFTYQLS
jgi:hypothetical protein